MCFEKGSGNSVDHASGGIGGVLVFFYNWSFIYSFGERVLEQLLPNNTSMISANFIFYRMISFFKYLQNNLGKDKNPSLKL